MLVLIVDDDPDACELLNDFILEAGHEAAQAHTAAEALKEIHAKKPQAVFLDVVLPDQSGLEVLKEIKIRYPGLPVVVVTGFKDAEVVVSAFRLGAFDCLLKPYNYDYLKDDILAKISQK